MTRLTVGGMRTWVGKLHVGQLVVLLAGITVVGLLASARADALRRESDSDRMMLATFRISDSIAYPFTMTSAKAAALQKEASEDDANRPLLTAVAVAVWASAFPILWWWFGVRRRTA
jgi:hypothetical protein